MHIGRNGTINLTDCARPDARQPALSLFRRLSEGRAGWSEAKLGFLLSLLMALCVGLSGCATSATTHKVSEYQSVWTEFTARFRKLSPQEYVVGSYLGSTNLTGAPYLHYQFPGVLGNDDARVLHVLVPDPTVSDSSTALITEGRARAAARLTPARLHVVHVGYASYMNGWVPAEFSEHCLRWFPPSEYGRVSLLQECPGRSPEWKDYPATVHLPWHRRNAVGVFAWGLCYVLAVPFDVVTFPVQLVVILTVKP